MSLQKKFKQQDKAIDRQVKELEKELIQGYETSLKRIRGELAKLYEKTDGNFAESQKYNRLANLEMSIMEEIRGLTKKNSNILRNGVGLIYEESFYRTAFLLEKEVNATLSYSLINKDAVREAIWNPLDRYGAGIQKNKKGKPIRNLGFIMRNTDNQTRLVRQINQEISQALIQGKAYSETAKILKNRLEVGAGAAVRIVQTETGRVRSKAKLDSMEHAVDMGVKLKKQWLSTIDDKTRDSHQELDGVTIGMNEQFEIDGDSADGPLMFADPANVINCRCQVISIVEGYEPKTRKARDEFEKSTAVPYQTYKEWKENLK